MPGRDLQRIRPVRSAQRRKLQKRLRVCPGIVESTVRALSVSGNTAGHGPLWPLLGGRSCNLRDRCVWAQA